MFSKAEEKQLRQEFWDSFSEYSKPRLQAEGKRKWLLYNTKIKGLELKFYVSRSGVAVLIEISHRSEDRRFRIFEALNDYKVLLDNNLPNQKWELIAETELGKEVAQIRNDMANVDYLDKKDWPQVFKFLCETMLQLEENFLDIYESLKNELKQ